MEENIEESISRPLIKFFRVFHACLADSIEDEHPKEQSDNGPGNGVTPQKQKGADNSKTCCLISNRKAEHVKTRISCQFLKIWIENQKIKRFATKWRKYYV
jgi:hypothetical protein